jgi:hypothetical protein
MAYFAIGLVREATPPKPVYTRAVLNSLKKRIIRYGRRHDHLPTDLGQLPPVQNEISDITDAWGFPVRYSREDGVVKLVSYGADGQPGGTGPDSDIVGIFITKTANDEWQDEICDWATEPFLVLD